jgi:hypothetical protein
MRTASPIAGYKFRMVGKSKFPLQFFWRKDLVGTSVGDSPTTLSDKNVRFITFSGVFVRLSPLFSIFVLVINKILGYMSTSVKSSARVLVQQSGKP